MSLGPWTGKFAALNWVLESHLVFSLPLKSLLFSLRVITGAQAQKINFYKKKSSCGKIKAKSVTYIKDGQLFNITVNQEVIVS